MALTFTFQRSIFNAADGGTAATNCRAQALTSGSSGVTLAITINTTSSAVSVWKSVGGQSWTLVNHGGITWGGDMSLIYAGGTTWYVVATPGVLYYSSNDGTTWTTTNTGVMAPQCNNSAATDGSGTAVFQGTTGGNTEWITAVATPPTVNTANFGTGNLGNDPTSGTMLWDGTNFVAINDNTANTSYVVLTAPSGFAQGAGPVWTLQQTFAISGSTLGSSINGAGGKVLGFVPGVGYLTAWSTGVNLATSYAALLANGALQHPLGTTNYCAFGVKDRFFIGEGTGKMAESTDGVTWTQDTPNFAVAGETLAHVSYDPVHNVFIILGSAGSVSLGQTQSPFGRGLPASSPGVILTPNNNVNAPAGFGGDRWGANGGGITPVGGGVGGLTGYDKPVKVTVSDGERAANYIISGGQNLAGAPVSVIGGMSNDALSGQTIDSSLPQGDSTLGTVG